MSWTRVSRKHRHECSGRTRISCAFSETMSEFWLGSLETVVKSAERFVQNAIDEKVPGVAPPISVLVITTSGFDWRKRGLCANGEGA